MQRILCILFIGSVLIAGCQTESSEIREAESQFEANPTGETYTALIQAYNDRIAELPAGKKRTALLQKAFEASRKQQSSINTMQFAKKLLIANPEHPDREEWLLALGNAYKSLNRQQVLNIFYIDFSKTFPDHEKADEFNNAIRTEEHNVDTLIQSLADNMFNDSLFRLETTLAYNFIDACELYSFMHPDDPKSAEYLHKAAETLRSLRSIPQSLKVYDRIIEEYPDHPRAVQSLFLKAFTYDNNIQQYDSARKYYELFLEKYPEDEFASSAEFLLENLGKSDEELLDVLQKKSGGQGQDTQ